MSLLQVIAGSNTLTRPCAMVPCTAAQVPNREGVAETAEFRMWIPGEGWVDSREIAAQVAAASKEFWEKRKKRKAGGKPAMKRAA